MCIMLTISFKKIFTNSGELFRLFSYGHEFSVSAVCMSVAVQPDEFPSLVKVTRELLAKNETFVENNNNAIK